MIVEVRRAIVATALSAGLLAAAGFFSAPASAVGVALIVAILAASFSPAGGVGAVILTLPWFYHPIAVGGSRFPSSELLLAATTLGFGFRLGLLFFVSDGREWSSLIRRIRSALASPIFCFAMGLAILGATFVLWPHDPAHRAETAREWRWTMFEPLLLVGLLFAVDDARWVRRFLAACLIACTTIVALDGIGDLITGGGVVADGVRRVSGPYPHPNALALFVARGFTLAVAWGTLEPRLRKLLCVPAAACGIGLLATLSRGALAATAVAMFILVVAVAPRWRAAAIGGVVVCTAGLLLLAGGRMLDALGGGSASLRIDIWSSALAMIRDNPVRGYGPDGFLYAYTPRYVAPTAWAERYTSHAHDLLFDFWVRLGIIGGAFVAFVVGYCWVAVAGFVRRPRQPGALRGAALLALFVATLHGLVDNGYFAHDLAMTAWLLAWLAFSESRPDDWKGAVASAGSRRRRIGLHWIASLR